MDENADGGNVIAVTTENADSVAVDDDRFEVAEGNLKLKAGTTLDFESDTSPIEVTITASAAGGDATHTVSVSINDVNEAPSIDVRDGEEVPGHDGVVSSLTIAENAMRADAPPLALIEVTDPDAADADMLTGDAGVAATSVSDDRFAVILDPEMGLWLHLAEGASLNYEDGAEVTVTVTFTDSAGNEASQDVTVTVTDVNEGPGAPVVVDADSLSVDENDAGASVSSVEAAIDPEGDEDITYHVDDDRFEISSGRVLKLKDGVSLNHESESSVTLEISARDSDGNEGAATTVTVNVNDVNEGPDATGTVAAVTANAGEDINADPIDLLALFNDPDAGDSAVRYTLSGGPSWLKFRVEYGEDDDGNDYAHGILEGKTPAGDDSVSKVTITASDSDGASGSASFYVISDDGNDAITDVDFLDSDGNVAVEAEVDENDASGVVFGEIKVYDQDHAMHPNGSHLIQILKGESSSPTASVDDRFEVKYDDAGIPWLALKEGKYLDYEKDEGSERGFVDVTIRVVDLNGATNRAGDTFTGNVEFQTVTIVINDQNDAPKANTIGNWWVTADDGLRADDVTKGSWLSFLLDTDGADAAFTDPDDGDTLTYSLTGPSILEINARTGAITNTEDGTPVRGVHRFTVTATDPDGESASASFYVAIALSGPDDSFTEDNDEPMIRVTSEVDYPENSGERRVATFTVTDDDNDLGHHPFALDSVAITSVVNADDDDDTNNDDTVARNDMTGYGGAFRLSAPVKSGDTWTYHVYVRDTNPSSRVDTTDVLNAEVVDRITITITANDGTAAAVTEEIDVRIDDMNDRPVAENIGGAGNTNIAGGTYGVNQSEAVKEVLYIKLEDIWNDAEDDSDDLEFSASVSGSWLKILHGPGEWGDIEDGRDGDAGTNDDVGWNVTDSNGDAPGGTQTPIVIGDDTEEPSSNELVVIIEIDRTGKNNGQGEEGSFTLTARDRDGGTASKTYKITPADQNLPASGAVTLSGSPREDATLRAHFDDNKDPDLAGSAAPALVLYQWFRVDDGGTEDLVSQGTGNSYKLTQADVGSSIRVKVKYYEVFGNQLVGNDLTRVDSDTSVAIDSATTSRAVTNTPDKGVAHVFTVLADANTLTVVDDNVRVTDGDRGEVAFSDLSFSWEMSDNGRGGWEPVTGATTATLTLPDGEGKYYRAVATYDADGGDDPDVDAAAEEMESVYSDPIQVSNVSDTTTPAPTISGSAFPGGTLSVNASNTSVQWQTQVAGNWVDIPGATGSLSLTQAHAGSLIRALVSYHSTDSKNPGVTAVVAVNANGGTAIPGATTGSATPVAVDDHDIEASVAGTGHHPTGADNNAGHNLSVTETVDLASLFQDPDSARLNFTVAADGDSGLGSSTDSGGTYVFDQASGGVLVFEVDGHTGKLTFNSDVYRTHDGSPDDGAGNVITLNITASDGTNTSTETAAVNLRINVAPTGINFNDAADGTGSENGTTTPINVNEHTGSAAVGRDGQFVAYVNVQDENEIDHDFGEHDVTVSGDDRFMITHTGYTSAADSKDIGGDGSTWEVRLKAGEKLDFESQADMDPVTPGKQIVLTLTATDGGGLSTPPGAANAIKLTITVVDVPSDNPPDADENNVPGLTDDETTDPDDERVDDGTDNDTDGGSHPPPPGTSIGGIIENFVDNMDTLEQDLFEDFMLVIDDIDVA